jgi:hypothetical protein
LMNKFKLFANQIKIFHTASNYFNYLEAQEKTILKATHF